MTHIQSQDGITHSTAPQTGSNYSQINQISRLSTPGGFYTRLFRGDKESQHIAIQVQVSLQALLSTQYARILPVMIAPFLAKVTLTLLGLALNHLLTVCESSTILVVLASCPILQRKFWTNFYQSSWP
ncbi:hypothetical protein ACRALDRAFT_210773 [Sodiomyces alcalophilus JCM 7366]|uniref:uncharacterized protein n=1 Tax=Sodiomyces alcalophilus JCM 7366 TaxID=591952 RepID=UPI0039B6D3D0